MEELNYILKQARRFHYTKWDESELEKCIGMMACLSRQELVSLHQSRWINGEKRIKTEIFKILFADKIGKREERIKEMRTDELIEEFLNKNSGNVALTRKELKNRYKDNLGEDRAKIALAFAKSSKADLRWLEIQLQKQLHGLSE